MTQLDRRTLNRTLLARQSLLERSPVSTTEMLTQLVGMQAQVPNSPYVGLWSRIDGFAPSDLASLIEERQAVRVALMRSTIHLVTADDCLSLRPVVAPVLARMFSPNSAWTKALGDIDLAELVAEGRRVLTERPRGHLDLGRALAERFSKTDPLALAHAIRNAVPLVQIPPRGVWGKSGRPLLVPAEHWLGREQSTISEPDELFLRYLAAFGPAAVEDFRRWSGLSRTAEMVKRLRPTLRVFTDDAGRELLDVDDAPVVEDADAPVRFLPEYDNVIIGFVDRTRMIHPADVRTVNANLNRPTFTVDGSIAGFWRATKRKRAISVEIEPIVELTRTQRAEVDDEATRLTNFLGVS